MHLFCVAIAKDLRRSDLFLNLYCFACCWTQGFATHPRLALKSAIFKVLAILSQSLG